MGRWRWERSGALAACAVSVVGCSQELRCYRGAVEINDVCECPSGHAYVRATDSCEPGEGLVDAATDTEDSQASASDARASTAVDARPGGGGTRGRDAEAVRDAAAATDAGSLTARDEEAGRVPLPVRSDAGAPSTPSCQAPSILCGALCVDPRNDAAHCGGCGACRVGSTCQNSACVEVGCSDGTREAFLDAKIFPTIAGCAATWPTASMRDARKLDRCGNSSVTCQVPLDACAAGWHVCGNTEGAATDIITRITQADCDTQPGAFAAALGDQACTPCSVDGPGAACCGAQCVQQQGSCLWPMATRWFGVRNGVLERCGSIDSSFPSDAIGVMCCRDAT